MLSGLLLSTRLTTALTVNVIRANVGTVGGGSRGGFARWNTLLRRNQSSQKPSSGTESRLKFQPTGFRVPEKESLKPMVEDNTGSGGSSRTPPSSSRSPRGLAAAAAAVGAVVLSWQLGPHTFAQGKARDVLQHYTSGFRTGISHVTEALVREVMSDMQLTKEEMGSTSAFLCYPQEAMSLGGFSSSRGFVLGLPVFVQSAELDLAKLRFGGAAAGGLSAGKQSGEAGGLSHSKLTSAEVQMLKDSMSLSDDAKRFVIARELSKGRAGHFATLALESGVVVLIAFSLCRLVKIQLGDSLFRRFPKLRFVAYAAVYAFALSACVLAQDLQRDSYARGYDEAACRLGAAYCRGGVEYYDKMLLRHRAMRALAPSSSGAAGSYTLKGDLVPGILRPRKHRPISARKDDCQRMLDQLSQSP